MAVSAATYPAGIRTDARWLRSRNWDLTWISLSVVLVAAPYLAYLGLMGLQSVIGPLADSLNATSESLSRNLVNALVALVVGGPHMYATFTRTALDHDFTRKHRRFVLSSLLIPAVVVGLAFFNLSLLLTAFFFWASIHVLHQIIFITELYNQREDKGLSLFSRAADYGIILTSLYPLAAVRIADGTFAIGTNNLSAVIGSIVPLGPWMVWLAGGSFAIATLAWLSKSYMEGQQGTLNGPKTIFIVPAVIAAFFVRVLGNLDTAFQGMRMWHSFQYLEGGVQVAQNRDEEGRD